MSRKRKINRRQLKVPEGHKVQFDFEEVQRLAEQNGLTVFLKANGSVLEIKSMINTWICKTNDEDMINLYHVVKDDKPHFQRSFLDYKFMFRSIRDHDIFKTEEDKGNRIFNMFKILETGNIPRVSFN